MTAQHRELATQTFSFAPRSLEEAEKYAMIIANSGICPQALKGRPNDVLVILQLGHELKLKPMQALRSLGCINGVPFAWGDGQLALVKNHSDFVGIKEWLEGDIKDNTLVAHCTITRRNQEPQTRSFDIEDAKRAGLWMNEKKPVWKMFPKRMLQHRARTFACRDMFPDALFGLMSEDEAFNIAPTQTNVAPIKAKGMSGLEEAMGIKDNETIIDAEYTTSDSSVSEPTEEAIPDQDASGTYVPEEHDPIIDEFQAIIEKHKVSEKTRKSWAVRHGVNSIDDLPIEAMKTVINHYQAKENK